MAQNLAKFVCWSIELGSVKTMIIGVFATSQMTQKESIFVGLWTKMVKTYMFSMNVIKILGYLPQKLVIFGKTAFRPILLSKCTIQTLKTNRYLSFDHRMLKLSGINYLIKVQLWVNWHFDPTTFCILGVLYYVGFFHVSLNVELLYERNRPYRKLIYYNTHW